jgi:hypothetical protein
MATTGDFTLAIDSMAIGQRNPTGETVIHSDQGTQLGFNGSSQRCLVRRSVEGGRGPRRVSSSRGSCVAGC